MESENRHAAIFVCAVAPVEEKMRMIIEEENEEYKRFFNDI
jgi:hypothetical protein